MSMIEQGTIHDFDSGEPRDRRQASRRPAVIVQTNSLNRVEGYPLTMIIPLTTRRRGVISHIEIVPSEENRLSAVSYAMCEQVFLIARTELGNQRGRLTHRELEAVKQGLRYVFSL
jgi:mRNA-degrading endonuclease toxin of MazEF toxin-antitoxin module